MARQILTDEEVQSTLFSLPDRDDVSDEEPDDDVDFEFGIDKEQMSKDEATRQDNEDEVANDDQSDIDMSEENDSNATEMEESETSSQAQGEESNNDDQDFSDTGERQSDSPNDQNKNNETDDEAYIYEPHEDEAYLFESTDSEEEDEYHWKKSTKTYLNTKPDFSRKMKINYDFLEGDNESVYFSQFFTDEILKHIVHQTNLYAAQEGTANWKNTTLEEIRAFIGMLIQMAIHKLPQLANYWSSDPILGVESISKVMTVKRFKKLLEALHCNDNHNMPPPGDPQYNKLYKLWPIIEMLNAACHSVCVPSAFVAVDESMVPFKGRSCLKQYMPLKPIKRGYKIWCLADSTTGYVSSFQVYTGKRDDATTEKGLGETVVLSLCDTIQERPSLVTFDNFFSSVSLMEELYVKNLYSCGTIRKDRTLVPKMFTDYDVLERGDYIWRVRGNVSAYKWMDSKEVFLLSTAHSPTESTTVKRKRKDGHREDVKCPTAIAEYNTKMGGVDRFD